MSRQEITKILVIARRGERTDGRGIEETGCSCADCDQDHPAQALIASEATTESVVVFSSEKSPRCYKQRSYCIYRVLSTERGMSPNGQDKDCKTVL